MNDHSLREWVARGPNPPMLPDDEDERLWKETARLLHGVADNLDILSNLPKVTVMNVSYAARQSQMLKNLSGRFLSSIESLLERNPSSEPLWDQWFFWRVIEGEVRPVKQLLERLEPVPPASLYEMLPNNAMDFYYADCRRTRNWPEVIEMLKPVWERELERVVEYQALPQELQTPQPGQDYTAYLGRVARFTLPRLANAVAAPMIEAYLNDGKPFEADELFIKCVETDLKFSDPEKLVDLAKSLGHERLAREWEEKTI
ncbi:MAG: hypothetical protein FWG12_05820 [Holophagaceae bacterium]|nr:hypothetical protein [Holophagaceae bacterium]